MRARLASTSSPAITFSTVSLPRVRADPARRALAAALDGAKLEGEASLPRHVDSIVEDHDATVTDEAILCGEGFVVEWRIEERTGKIGPKRAADLHGADLTARRRASPDVVDELAEGDAEGRFVEAAVLDVAGELDRHRAARATHAVVGIGLRTLGKNERHRREREHVVDHGRAAEQALVGGERRLGANDAALALEAFEQRGLLAADIGAGAHADFEFEGMLRAGDLGAEEAGPARGRDRLVEGNLGMGILGAQVDVARGRADGEPSDRHALDQHERVAFHDHAIGEGPAVALVSVADDILLGRFRVVDGLPLDAGREAGSAPAPQSGLGNLVDDAGGRQLEGPVEALVAAMGAIVVERHGIGHAAARERKARLPLEVGDLLDPPHRPRMLDRRGRLTAEEARLGEARDICRLERTEAPANALVLDLEQRLEPQHAARAVADNFSFRSRLLRRRCERRHQLVGADGDGGCIARHEKSQCHAVASLRI